MAIYTVTVQTLSVGSSVKWNRFQKDQVDGRITFAVDGLQFDVNLEGNPGIEHVKQLIEKMAEEVHGSVGVMAKQAEAELEAIGRTPTPASNQDF